MTRRGIVEETLAPWAKVTEVARRDGVAASVLFTWRQQARTVERAGPCFAPVQIAPAAATGEDNTKSRRSLREIIELHLTLASDFHNAAPFELKRVT
jgi:transposase-like protein